MLPLLAFVPAPPPTGTTTMGELCRWLTEQTGVTHSPGSELRDYPVFLSVHSSEPGRIRALVAKALAGEWVQDGSTVRLEPVKPTPGEGEAEFTREYKAAVDPKSALAMLPPSEVMALVPGRTLRFGYPESTYVHPLPAALRAKVQASEKQSGYIYLRRFAHGFFEMKVQLPSESHTIFSGESDVQFRTLPPEVAAALGDEAKLPALDAAAKQKLQKLAGDPASAKIDPKTFDRVDPLVGFTQPILGPVAKALKEDLVVALSDFSIMTLMGGDPSTVEGVMKGFSTTVDWTAGDGAFVGRLPMCERLHRAQTRRALLASFIQKAQATGVADAVELGRYLAAQRPVASESWSDVVMLVMSGIVIDDSFLGDHPYNLRLGSAMSARDWDLLKSGRPVTAADLSPAAYAALIDLLVQSRERMDDKQPDPVLWRGFPNVKLGLTAKVEDEMVVIGRRGGIDTAMTLEDAGLSYDRLKGELGREPLFRPAHRRKLTLTIGQIGTEESVKTGFGQITVDSLSKPVAWQDLPADFAKGMAEAMKMREGVPTAPAGVP